VLELQGNQVDTGGALAVRLPITMFEADIGVDIIVSYSWLAALNLLVNPRRHGLIAEWEGSRVWMAGTRPEKPPRIVSAADCAAITPQVVGDETAGVAPQKKSCSLPEGGVGQSAKKKWRSHESWRRRPPPWCVGNRGRGP
jgi:hypothetical protein